MDTEESEESAQYPYLGSPLSKEEESITPDLLERDDAANKAIQDIPLPQEPSTPHRYIEDPTSALMNDEIPETKSYGFLSPSGVVPGMEILCILCTGNKRCRICSKNFKLFLLLNWFYF